MRTRGSPHARLVFVLLLASYAWFWQGGGWNPNSRMALTRALVERGEISIDGYLHTGDWAYYGGRYYTNKPPGLSLASAPVHALAGTAARLVPGGASLSTRAYATNLVVNALPSALLGVLLFQTLGLVGVGAPTPRAWAALAFGLGTLAFPYATAYYAHQPAAFLGFAAFYTLLRARDAKRPRASATLCGALVGLAVLFEASTALVAVAHGAAVLADARLRRHAAFFVLGGLPPAILLGTYELAAFGSPFTLWFEHANPEVEVRRDGALFGIPTFESLAGLLVLPWRGLFFTSPVLLLGVLGWPLLWRNDRSAALVCAAIPLAFLGLLSSFHGWYGGWAPGARYLIPCLPFLFVPAGLAIERWPRVAIALAVPSVAAMFAITAVAVEIPDGFGNPLFDFVLPRLAEGRVAVNPQGLEDLLPPRAYLQGGGPENDASFNLGELAFPHGILSLVPLLLVWFGLGIALARASDPHSGRTLE